VNLILVDGKKQTKSFAKFRNFVSVISDYFKHLLFAYRLSRATENWL